MWEAAPHNIIIRKTQIKIMRHPYTPTACSVASVVSASLWPHGLQPARLLCPWDSLGKNAGVGAIPLSRGSSRPRDPPWVPYVSCIAGAFFFTSATWDAHTPIRMAKIWNNDKNQMLVREKSSRNSFIAGGKTIWCGHFRRHHGLPIKLNTLWLYISAFNCAIYLKEVKTNVQWKPSHRCLQCLFS